MKELWTWLEPLGYAAGFGESLLSMYRRAAVTFSASLIEIMRESCVAAGFPPFKVEYYSENINGCGWPTRRLVRSLSAVTGRSDLAATTLADAIGPHEHLLRTKRAWCPDCLRDRVTYAPLLWSLRDYTTCLRHSLRMQSTCGACGREERHLLARSDSSTCAWCEAPLSEAERIGATPGPRTLAVARAVGLFHAGDLGAVARASDFAREMLFGTVAVEAEELRRPGRSRARNGASADAV
jgi:hypothetical protein